MNIKLLKLALDSNLINYVEHETPRNYFVDGYADIETVQEFANSIIRECDRYVADHFDEMEPWMYPGDLLEHFGIEK